VDACAIEKEWNIDEGVCVESEVVLLE